MSFENLDVWKRATQLCIDVYQNLRGLKDYGFKDQITRAALSIPSNIAEGEERTSHKDTIQFLNYARGSTAELQTQVYIGMEIGYIPNTLGKQWIQETKEIAAMITGLINSKRHLTSDN